VTSQPGHFSTREINPDKPDKGANGSLLSLREAKALHEVGVAHHGWYMTESEHRGVLEVLETLESLLREATNRALAPDMKERIWAVIGHE
jgi:hypothetical protein